MWIPRGETTNDTSVGGIAVSQVDTKSDDETIHGTDIYPMKITNAFKLHPCKL